ncbi:MAG: MBL fold metallo-hydrolase [Clostridia bacterium]|nr:MBL fold metallo-hydrolase [Clostridia bacterium]
MKISKDIIYIGVNDTKIDLFEAQYRVPQGMSYNSYVILDEKVAVMDTVDAAFAHGWLDNLEKALGERVPDYLIVQHMEPDHSANIANFLKKYPEAKVVCNQKTIKMIEQFFGESYEDRRVIVENGGSLSLGEHNLLFVFAPMVHWPEVMMTYDSKDKVLFSADAFGRFGAWDADIPWEDEARRYYIGIVGKYGAQTQAVLKKIEGLPLEKIAPLHGPVIKENLAHYIKLYDIWSSYEPEEDGIVIAYNSVYGHTAKAVKVLCDTYIPENVRVEVFDLARADRSAAIAAAFRYSKLVLAGTTYNNGLFPCMKEFIDGLTERNYQKRTVGFIENGSWAPTSAKNMKAMLEQSKNITFCENTVTIKSEIIQENKEQLSKLAAELCQ